LAAAAISPLAAPELLLDGVAFPEGPRWHAGELWFSDILGQRIYRCSTGGRLEVVIRLEDELPSGLGFLPDGSLIFVAMQARKLMRLSGGELTVHADLSALPGHSLNDMLVDATGRAYVGNRLPRRPGLQPYDSDPERMESVFLVQDDGSVSVAADDLDGPNGMEISPDGRTLIVAETRGGRLTAFDVEADGRLTGRRVFAEFVRATPDGICLDAEGAVWAGSALTGEFLRVLEGGTITHRHALTDGFWALACALGGPDGRSLFLMTALWSMDEHGGRMRPGGSNAKGRILRATVDVPSAIRTAVAQ
jgi:sugar lactone lactonase YvrE